MPDLALVTADKVEIFDSVKELQKSAPCAVNVTAGKLVRLDANGNWILSDSGAAGTLTGSYFAGFSVQAGQGLTGFKKCKVDGLAVSALAYNDALFAGVAGAIGTTAGVSSLQVGRVVTGHSGTPTPKKIVQIDIPL